jgi:uncharacterized membrane protein (DUF373 family)
VEVAVPVTIVFIIRALVGLLCGILLSRFFYPQATVEFIIGLSAILVALSYLSAYLRRPRK